MQTFLPYPDFDLTATTLDDKRLFKQVVETRQILACLGCDVFRNDGEPFSTKGFVNHPAKKMWEGYSNALKLYHNVLLRECFSRKFNTQIKYLTIHGIVFFPKWMGDERFHTSHRSNLLRKSDHYKQFGWSEPDNLPYFWPTKELTYLKNSA